MQGAGLFLDDKELDLLTNLHTETDLGERCVPVGRQLGLLVVKPSLASWKVLGNFVVKFLSRTILLYRSRPLFQSFSLSFYE